MGKKRIILIDYLKAIAILFVILDHIGIAPSQSLVYCFGIRMAVPIFMVLSGYTFALSYEKQKSLKEMYSWKFLRGKLERFLVPAVVTCAFMWCINGNKSFFKMFFWGGYGQGAYYPGLMLQMLLIFPIMLKMLECKSVNVLIIVAVNVVLEVAAWLFEINNSLYRITIFRYITYIAVGILIFKGIKFTIWSLAVSFFLGVIYIYMIGRMGYQPYIFKNWSNTALPVVLYIFPIMYFLLNKMKDFNICGVVGKCLEVIGKASYHILFAQMFTRVMWVKFGSIEFWSVIFIRGVVSIVLGVIFWKMENVIRNRVRGLEF